MFNGVFQRVTVQKLSASAESVVKRNPAAEKRERIVRRAALEFRDGMYGKLPVKCHTYNNF